MKLPTLPRWPGWAHLPREPRDTLFLLLVIGWTVLPHLPHLPLWCGALTGVVLLWRAWLALANAPLPGRVSLITVLLVAAGLTWWSQRTLLGKDAGVTMLVVLMALKTLELRARRDALVVFFLGFFIVLTNFLYSQTLLVAVAMVASVWGLLTALVLAHMPVGRPPLARAGALAARTAAFGAPLMVLLFMLFPRFGPLWGLPQDGLGHTGLSGTLRLGGVAEVANDDSIALRVRFPEGQVPQQEQLYFRGPVLSRFDGLEWKNDPRSMLSSPASMWRQNDVVRLHGQPLRYEMTVEPLNLPMLPLLEMTPPIDGARPRIDNYVLMPKVDLTWPTDRIINERLRFSAMAWPEHTHGPREPVATLRDAVELPPAVNPRTLAWAAQMRNQPRYANASPRELAQALLEHIRGQGYSYTLSPGNYGSNSIDEFWLDRRAGFCEHFAAAFVVVMRGMDVPARIVTGYQGADPVPVDGWWIVRQSHAHAWAEFWQPGEGWVRADPTAAVAPERIQRGRALLPQPGFVAGALGTVNPELLAQMRALWEATNNRWNQWVLSYSRSKQIDLLESLGVKDPHWSDLGLVLAWVLAAAGLGGAAWAWRDRHRTDPWQRLQRRVRRELAKLNVDAPPHLGYRAQAQAVRAALGEHGAALAQVLEELDAQRYGREALRRPSPAWWPRFRAAAQAMAGPRPG